MRTFSGIVVFFIMLVMTAGCGSAQKKKEVSMKSARTDSGITVKDENFKFEGAKKVILYNEVDDEDSNAILNQVAEALRKKGVEAVIDTGESMNYEGDNFRIRTYKNLMSFYYNLKILKSGGKKGNEDVIADIKADSITKLVDITINFIFEK